MTLQELIQQLKEPRLKEIAEFFARNIQRARHLAEFHEEMLRMRALDKMLDKISELITRVQQNEISHEEYDRLLEEEFGSGPAYFLKALGKEHERFEINVTQAFKHVPGTIRMLQQSSVMATWSALEVAASDTWVSAVNAGP